MTAESAGLLRGRPDHSQITGRHRVMHLAADGHA